MLITFRLQNRCYFNFQVVYSAAQKTGEKGKLKFLSSLLKIKAKLNFFDGSGNIN